MSEQLPIDFSAPSLGHDLARTLRDEGMARSADHAERVNPGWQDRAVSFIRSYAITHEQFMCEGARRYAEARGIGSPPDKRAWGTAMIKAAKASIVKKVGLAYATDPKVHMNPASLWKSLIFSPAACAAETPAPSTVADAAHADCRNAPVTLPENSYAKGTT